MYRSFTFEELLSLSKDEVKELKGLDVVVTKRDGNVIESTIANIMLAFEDRSLPCGFVLSNGIKVGFDSIRLIEVEK